MSDVDRSISVTVTDVEVGELLIDEQVSSTEVWYIESVEVLSADGFSETRDVFVGVASDFQRSQHRKFSDLFNDVDNICKHAEVSGALTTTDTASFNEATVDEYAYPGDNLLCDASGSTSDGEAQILIRARRVA